MEKYDLSAKHLEMVLRKLVEADLITHMQLYERTTLSDAQVTKAFVIPRGRLRSWIEGSCGPMFPGPPKMGALSS
jgi:hypothetical protein